MLSKVTLGPVVLLSLAVAACSTPQRATPAAATTTNTPPDAQADASAADPRRDAVLAAWRRAHAASSSANPQVVAGPVEWPGAPDGATRVVAVVANGEEGTLVATTVPPAEGTSADTALSFTGPASAAIRGISVRDVNGDGAQDVAVFFASEDVLEGYAPMQRFMRLYTVRPAAPWTFVGMPRAEVQLYGVRDDAALAAAIPGLNTYEAPADGMSPGRFLARLGFATPEQFRAALAPGGLRLCTDFPDRTERRRKRCTNYTTARVTDALITSRIRRDLGGFAEFSEDESASGLQEPSCERQASELRCGANVGGPAGVNWTLRGEGASMRIVEISPWAEAS